MKRKEFKLEKRRYVVTVDCYSRASISDDKYDLKIMLEDGYQPGCISGVEVAGIVKKRMVPQ